MTPDSITFTSEENKIRRRWLFWAVVVPALFVLAMFALSLWIVFTMSIATLHFEIVGPTLLFGFFCGQRFISPISAPTKRLERDSYSLC